MRNSDSPKIYLTHMCFSMLILIFQPGISKKYIHIGNFQDAGSSVPVRVKKKEKGKLK